MTREEFQAIAKVKVNSQDFDKIHEVYNFHPCISNDSIQAKKDIAKIYNMGGMLIIEDMLIRATRVSEAERKLNRIKAQLQEAEHELREISIY